MGKIWRIAKNNMKMKQIFCKDTFLFHSKTTSPRILDLSDMGDM